MNYTLMHKDIPVLDMELDESTCSIQKLGTAYRIEHLPLGTFHRNIVDRTELNAWWTDRSIPASRSGVRRALETLDLPNTQLLLTRCFGLSLSDQYWVKPQDSGLQWEDINFFCNPFSEDIGNVLLGKALKTDSFDFSSPDNTSDSYLKKRWKIVGGKRCLLKAGSNPFMQQPFNEVIIGCSHDGCRDRGCLPRLRWGRKHSANVPLSRQASSIGPLLRGKPAGPVPAGSGL